MPNVYTECDNFRGLLRVSLQAYFCCKLKPSNDALLCLPGLVAGNQFDWFFSNVCTKHECQNRTKTACSEGYATSLHQVHSKASAF